MHLYRYRVHSVAGDDLGLVEHPAPNLETGDVVMTEDGRRWVVTRHIETPPGSRVGRWLEVEEAPDA